MAITRKDLAEGAPYRHPSHGDIRVVDVDDDVVVYEVTERKLSGTQFYPMYEDSVEAFLDRVDSRPVHVSTPSTEFKLKTNIS